MAVREILKVKVEREAIDKGRREDSRGCPIVQAMRPMLKEGGEIKVGGFFINLSAPRDPTIPSLRREF